MERIYALDSLKFFLIILVIYGHIYSGEQGMYGVRFVYLFHMPLFAYISGFFLPFVQIPVVSIAKIRNCCYTM